MLRASPRTLLSKKQPIVALSFSKAKYMELPTTIKESIWLNKLLKDFALKISKSISIYCNNKRGIKTTKNLDINPYIKHIAIHHYFIRK